MVAEVRTEYRYELNRSIIQEFYFFLCFSGSIFVPLKFNFMKIGICNDHAGVEYKNDLVAYLTGKGYEMVNFGTDTTASMD